MEVVRQTVGLPRQIGLLCYMSGLEISVSIEEQAVEAGTLNHDLGTLPYPTVNTSSESVTLISASHGSATSESMNTSANPYSTNCQFYMQFKIYLGQMTSCTGREGRTSTP
jgi:hypothetical protein